MVDEGCLRLLAGTSVPGSLPVPDEGGVQSSGRRRAPSQVRGTPQTQGRRRPRPDSVGDSCVFGRGLAEEVEVGVSEGTS